MFFNIQHKGEVNANGENDSFCREFKKFKWRENLKDKFMSNFTSVYEVMQEAILNKLTISIDDYVQSIVEMYQKACECMQIKGSMSDFAKQEPWWDSECDRLKKKNSRL